MKTELIDEESGQQAFQHTWQNLKAISNPIQGLIPQNYSSIKYEIRNLNTIAEQEPILHNRKRKWQQKTKMARTNRTEMARTNRTENAEHKWKCSKTQNIKSERKMNF